MFYLIIDQCYLNEVIEEVILRPACMISFQLGYIASGQDLHFVFHNNGSFMKVSG